jgi:hypothetical protein
VPQHPVLMEGRVKRLEDSITAHARQGGQGRPAMSVSTNVPNIITLYASLLFLNSINREHVFLYLERRYHQ